MLSIFPEETVFRKKKIELIPIISIKEKIRKKITMRRNQKETVRGLVREVNELREDFKEIKNLLTKMVNTNGR